MCACWSYPSKGFKNQDHQCTEPTDDVTNVSVGGILITHTQYANIMVFVISSSSINHVSDIS